jgi:hypothetical protein
MEITMAQDTPPGDGDHVEHAHNAPGRAPGAIEGYPQGGRVWVKPYNGDAKWSAAVADIRIVARYQGR